MTVSASWLKCGAFLLLSGAAAYVSWKFGDPGVWTYLATALFGLAALFFFLLLIPGSSCLVIGHEGIRVRYLWIEQGFYRWPDISRIRAVELKGAARGIPTRTRFVGLTLSGRGEKALPNIFSLPAPRLAELLEARRLEVQGHGTL